MKKFFTHGLPYAIIFWLIMGFVLFLIVDSIVMPIIAGHNKEIIEVPSVVGKKAEDAEKLIIQSGLKVKWQKEKRYSAKIPMGHVMIQMPIKGRGVKEGRNIVLTLSKGNREVVLPSLRGSSKRQAEITLNRLGLKLGKMIDGAHASIPRGVVIRSVPASNKKIRIGSEVDLVISSGDKSGKVKLPEMTGMAFYKVQSLVDSLGFKMGEITKKASTEQLSNTVISHLPKHGEFLNNGEVIDFVIAK